MEVDHRIPLDVAPERMYDETNLQTLCRDCHFSKSQEERKGKPPSREVQEWQRYFRAFSFSCLVGKAHHVESFAEMGIVAA